MGSSEFPRALLGYRRGSVDVALAARDEQLVRLQAEVTRLTASLVERDRELSASLVETEKARTELERLRADHYESLKALDSASRRLEELHAQARGQATRIRLKALREAIEVADRVAELVRLRDEMSGRLRTALEETANRLNGFEGGAAVQEIVERAGIDMGALDQARDRIARLAAGAGRGRGGTEDAGEEADEAPLVALGTNGHAESPAGLFEGLVRVEIGPLDDFSQLVSFEDAAGDIASTAEISNRAVLRRPRHPGDAPGGAGGAAARAGGALADGVQGARPDRRPRRPGPGRRVAHTSAPRRSHIWHVGPLLRRTMYANIRSC